MVIEQNFRHNREQLRNTTISPPAGLERAAPGFRYGALITELRKAVVELDSKYEACKLAHLSGIYGGVEGYGKGVVVASGK